MTSPLGNLLGASRLLQTPVWRLFLVHFSDKGGGCLPVWQHLPPPSAFIIEYRHLRGQMLIP